MNTYIVNVTGTYTRDEIPPRCRKPRPVTHEASAQVDIPMVTSDDAPVAFRVHGVEDHAKEIRTFKGHLFSPYLPHYRQNEPTLPGSIYFPQDVNTEHEHTVRYNLGYDIDSEKAFRDAAATYYRRFLIVDGIVWTTTKEPCYEVATFGMGRNHGGTSLMVGTVSRGGYVFRADEFEMARAHAIEVAEQRGDSLSIPRMREDDGERIEVLLSEAVTVVPTHPAPLEVRRLRSEYGAAVARLRDAHNATEDEECFAEVARLRQEITERGFTPFEGRPEPREGRWDVAA